jgi:hypothetical protein
MSPIHCLQICLWIPITIIKDHGIRRHQINAQPPCPRAQQKNKGITVLFCEMLDLLVTGFHGSVSVYTVVFELTHIQVIFHYVKNPRHLREEKHLVAGGGVRQFL